MNERSPSEGRSSKQHSGPNSMCICWRKERTLYVSQIHKYKALQHLPTQWRPRLLQIDASLSHPMKQQAMHVRTPLPQFIGNTKHRARPQQQQSQRPQYTSQLKNRRRMEPEKMIMATRNVPEITSLDELTSEVMAEILKAHFGTGDVKVTNDLEAQVLVNKNQFFTSGK